MSIQDNWLANLRALVDRLAPGDGRGVKRPAFREIATRTGTSVEYVYQLYTGKNNKVVGVDFAKTLARVFAEGRDPSWFDAPPAQATSRWMNPRQYDWPFPNIEPQTFEELEPYQKIEIQARVRDLIERYHSDNAAKLNTQSSSPSQATAGKASAEAGKPARGRMSA